MQCLYSASTCTCIDLTYKHQNKNRPKTHKISYCEDKFTEDVIHYSSSFNKILYIFTHQICTIIQWKQPKVQGIRRVCGFAWRTQYYLENNPTIQPGTDSFVVLPASVAFILPVIQTYWQPFDANTVNSSHWWCSQRVLSLKQGFRRIHIH
jgi:hypothetical protein